MGIWSKAKEQTIPEPDRTVIDLGTDGWVKHPTGGISKGSFILRGGTTSCNVWFYTYDNKSFYFSNLPETQAFFINALVNAKESDGK